MKKKGLFAGMLAQVTAVTLALTLGMVFTGCAPAADSPPPNSGASLAAASTLGGAAIGVLGGQTGADEANAVTAMVAVLHANRATATFAAAFDNGSGGAAVTAYADSGTGSGTYAALANYAFTTSTTLWLKVVSQDGSATKYYKISVTVGAPVITTLKTALLAADTGITITGSGFKASPALGDFTIAGTNSGRVTAVAADPAPTATSVTFTVSGLATADIFSITAKTSAFDPAASAASNTLNFAVPDADWTTSYSLTDAYVSGKGAGTVAFYKVTVPPAETPTIITTKAEMAAVLGAPIPGISAADAGKTLVAAEYDANNFITKMGSRVLAGVEATDTGTGKITLAAVSAVPPVSAALEGAPKTINAVIGTALTTGNTLTVSLTNAVVKEALSSATVASWFSATVTGLTYTASALANATSITVTIGGTASARETTNSTVTIPATALKYVNGTAYASTLEVTGVLTISAANNVTPSGKTYYLNYNGFSKTVFSTAAGGTSGTYAKTSYRWGESSYTNAVTEEGTYSWNPGTRIVTLTPTKASQGSNNGFGTLQTQQEMADEVPTEEISLDQMNEMVGATFTQKSEFYAFVSAYLGTTIENWSQFRAAYIGMIAAEFAPVPHNYAFSVDETALFLDGVLPANSGANDLSGKSFNGVKWNTNQYEKDTTKTYVFAASGTTYTYADTAASTDNHSGTYAYNGNQKRVFLKRPTTNRESDYTASSGSETGPFDTVAHYKIAQVNGRYHIQDYNYDTETSVIGGGN